MHKCWNIFQYNLKNKKKRTRTKKIFWQKNIKKKYHCYTMFPTPCSHFTSYFTNSKFKILSTIIDSLQSRYYKSIWITLYMENLKFFLNKHCCNDFTYRFNQSFKSEHFYIFLYCQAIFYVLPFGRGRTRHFGGDRQQQRPIWAKRPWCRVPQRIHTVRTRTKKNWKGNL